MTSPKGERHLRQHELLRCADFYWKVNRLSGNELVTCIVDGSCDLASRGGFGSLFLLPLVVM